MSYSVKDVVCDYGVYEGDNLIHIFNDKCNAELVKKVLELDSKHERYEASEINTEDSSYEIRLFDHKTNKVLYSDLSEYQLKAIAEILNKDWENI